MKKTIFYTENGKVKPISSSSRYFSRGAKPAFVVRKVSSKILGDYGGMNAEAAQDMGFTPKLGDHDILLADDLSKERFTCDLKHEIIEHALMKPTSDGGRGFPYWKAHRIALKEEKK